MKTERENVNIIGGTFEDKNADSNLRYNRYDKDSREKIMVKLLPSGKRILDMGCSIGAWGDFFRKKGYSEIYGIDISKDRLSIAAKRGYKTFNVHGTELPFQNNFFDAVVCIDVLVHTIKKDDRFKMVKEAARVLKKDSPFIYSINNLKFENISKSINIYLPEEKRHVKTEYCDPIYLSEAREMTEKAGLEMTKIRGLQFIFPSLLVKIPTILKFLDKVFSDTFAKEYAKIIFVKAVKR